MLKSCWMLSALVSEMAGEAQQKTETAGLPDPAANQGSIWQWLVDELLGSPVNMILLFAILFLIYKILKSDNDEARPEPEPPLPRMKKRDFTPRQLKEFDGTGHDGRVLVAVLGRVFDVTRGKRFYGHGGPYQAFAGRDASRGLATFNAHSASEEYDDLSDLKPSEMDQVKEWELQFSEKYDVVGKLLKPDEEPTVYTDDEDDANDQK